MSEQTYGWPSQGARRREVPAASDVRDLHMTLLHTRATKLQRVAICAVFREGGKDGRGRAIDPAALGLELHRGGFVPDAEAGKRAIIRAISTARVALDLISWGQ